MSPDDRPIPIPIHSRGAATSHQWSARIAHVIYHLDVGGAELFLCDLALAFATSGLAQHVFCVGPAGPQATGLAGAGVPVTALGKRSRLGLMTIVTLARALRAFRPDIVQTHGEAGVFWGIPAARLAASPAVCALVYQNYLETRAKMLVSRLFLPRVDLVIAGSNSVRAFVVERFGVRPGRVVMVPCGLRVAAFRSERPARAASNATRLVTVGRLVTRKGHAVAVRAMPRILASCPDAELWIVGDGPERPRLEALIREHGVERHVRLPGTIWPSGSVLAGADLFLFPSLEEPQGLAVLEAFAAGVPVVASRTGGIAEMVEDEVTGVLVEPGNVEALAVAVTKLLADRIVAVSEGVRADLERAGVPSEKIQVIPNGIDLCRLAEARSREDIRRAWGVEATQIVIGAVALLKEQKAIDDLIEAARLLADRGCRATILVFGDGPLRRRLERQASDLPDGPCRLRFMGWVDDVMNDLPGLDLFVLPSRWEGLPVALLEAMGHGLPSVGTRVAGIEDVIGDDGVGRLVPPERPDALADAIEALVRDSDLRRRLGGAAARRARECFDAASVARAHDELYGRLLDMDFRTVSASAGR